MNKLAKILVLWLSLFVLGTWGGSALAAVAYGAAGAVAAGTTPLDVPHPAGIVAGNLLVLVVGNKFSPANPPATPGGWTLVGQGAGGLGDTGTSDQGPVFSTIFVKEAVGGESGNLAVTLTGANSSMGRMFRYTKAAGTSWNYAATDGSDNTAGTAWSVTGAANPGITAGDMLIVGSAVNTDTYTFSAESVAATGATLGTHTERQDSGNGTGRDMRLVASDHTVTGGTATAAPLFTMTASGSGTNRPTGASVILRIREVPNPTTTLATGTDPAAATIAPGATVTDVNQFTLQTSSGTEAITSVTVNLSTNSGVGLLGITSDDGSVVLGSTASPVTGSNTIAVAGMSATTTLTAFKVRVTPLSHAAMPLPNGAAYAITAPVTAWAGPNTHAGSDTNPNALTIDNLSPNGATAVSGSAGNTQNTINWTSSNSADFATTSGSVVYRWAAASAGAEVPAEGSAPTLGSTNATATVACLVSSAVSAPLVRIDGTGGSVDCTTVALTNGQAYTYKVFQQDTSGNYDVGVIVGTVISPTVISINTASVNPTTIGSAVAWTVLFNTSVTGVSAANFQLVPGVGVAGATITSVTPAPGSSSTTWTVNVYVGTGAGILGLNMANVTSIIPAVTTTMPFVGQTYTIYPVLTCVVAGDTFTGANNSVPDSGNWDVRRVSGSFTPLIYGNRLRITDISTSVATRATNQNIFNFGNNVVVAEFDYWAYGGSGADGIAVTFSDPNFGGPPINANNPPTAGGFGGSLGYANRDTGGTCNVAGFTGGWIGVGIDEFGNYSNPLSSDGLSNECRNGGPGFRPNAVAIRGSGSLATSPSTSNYYYLAGTAALGANGVSSGLTTTAYRYRITLDASSDTSKVMVKLDQNKGAGYSNLISYDLKPDITAGRQTALPAQLQFTFTGSTGASTNYHEVDNLSICTSSAVSILDHVAIDAPTAAMTSTAVPVTISPHDAAHAPFSNAGTISLSTSTGAGDWSGTGVTPGAANSGLATYTFGVGETSVTLNFTYQSAATVTLNVAGAGGSNLLLNTPAGEKANIIVFTTSGFVFTDNACVHNIAFGGVGQTCALLNWSPQVAGQTLNSIYITNVSAGKPTRFSQSNPTTRNMQYGLSCHDPATNAGKLATFSATANTFPLCQSNGATPTTWTTATNITFPANIPSAGPFSFNYPDVGEVEFWMRNFASQTQTGSSGAFVVKPGGFVLTAIKRTSNNFANPAAADAAGTAFIKAGDAFSVTVTATTCSSGSACTVVGATTPNYGKETTRENVRFVDTSLLASNPNYANHGKLVIGLGLTANPSFTCSIQANTSTCDSTTTPLTPIPKFGPFTLGVATGDNFVWNEVGIITLTPSVGDGDYLGAGDTVGTPSGNVGRFYPDHFVMTGTPAVATRNDLSCSPPSNFTYMGESLGVSFTLEARNASDVRTQNYRDDASAAKHFAKLDGATVSKWTQYAANDSLGLWGIGIMEAPYATCKGIFSTISPYSTTYAVPPCPTSPSSPIAQSPVAPRITVLPSPAPSGAWTTGSGSFAASLTVGRAALADGPYLVSLGVAPQDADGITLLPGAFDLNADNSGGAGANERKLLGPAEVRFGRLRMQNAYGSELLALPVPMEAQYWAGSYYATNTADSCTVIPMSSITMGNYLKQLNACETQLTPVGNVTMAAGKLPGTGLVLTKPGATNAGSVDLAINVSVTAAGNTCVGATQSAATAANMPWFGPNLGSRATFGIYKSPLIYRRENY